MRISNADISILIVDDEEDALRSEALALQLAGCRNVVTCSDSRQVQALIEKYQCEIVVLDITMPYIDGVALLRLLFKTYSNITVIMLTASYEPDTIVLCMKEGAFDYIVKPVDPQRLTKSIHDAIEHRRAQKAVYAAVHHMPVRQRAGNAAAFEKIITQSPKMFAVFHYIEAIASSKRPVLITGETGVGKDMMAETVHRASGAEGKFVVVNCAGIDDVMFSDTLFGHVRNAFTGAGNMRDGLVKKAAHGTLFLDEIGELRMESQIKLLRLMQDGSFYPMGCDECDYSSARIVVATNKNLQKAVARGSFRNDLFYRLQAHHIHIPPLRERLDDVELLLHHFLALSAHEMGKSIPLVPSELMILLKNYEFPGNIRELESMVHDAVSLFSHKGVISCETFKRAIKKKKSNDAASGTTKEKSSKILFPQSLPSLDEVKKELVIEAMRRSRGNKSVAATMIGTTRKTFRIALGNKNPSLRMC